MKNITQNNHVYHHHHHHQPISSHCWAKASPNLCQLFRSLVCLIQAVVLVWLTSSSLHLARGLPLFLFPYKGCHSVVSWLHLSSVILPKCPAHLHLIFFAVVIASFTFVWSLTHAFVLWSLLVYPSIILSMLLCVVCIFLSISLLKDHVSLPYVMAGRMHWLNSFLFKQFGMLFSLRMSLCLLKATQPACIFPRISRIYWI